MDLRDRLSREGISDSIPHLCKRAIPASDRLVTVKILAPLAVVVVFAAGCAGDIPPAPGTAQKPVVASPSTAAPSPSPVESTTAPEFTVSRDDFTIRLKILRKQCFGDAGCNVSYRIDPTYVGDQDLPDEGTIEVSYRVSGDESGPIENTFTVEGGKASFDKEEDASTPSAQTKLKVKVTDATYDADS